MNQRHCVYSRMSAMGMVCASVLAVSSACGAAEAIDLAGASVVIDAQARVSDRGPGLAARVLVEEVEKRTGILWPLVEEWPERGAAIALAIAGSDTVVGRAVPANIRPDREDGYGIATDVLDPARPVVWVVGADERGALYGVGHLLRNLDWSEGAARLPHPIRVVTAPEYPIRGHQLGYRGKSHSYDAWDVARYEQYIRELALFGLNCIENIPFDGSDSPHMTVSREDMNRALSEICLRYGLDYWVWTPAPFDLNDANRRAAALDEHEAFYADCPRLDAVFFPGGDPGDNHPSLVMPFLRDIAARLAKHHPDAKVWISLQGFNEERIDYFYEWVEKERPDWLGGAVAGPSSPPIGETRMRLAKEYGLRHYPDITHTVRSQYPTAWWDPAFAFTLGREPINPEPVRYAYVHNVYAPFTDGFITYSDGMNDDVNKTVFSALGWDSRRDVRGILVEYCRLFFGGELAERAADGILALERNWHGSLAENGGVEATLTLWRDLEAANPQLDGNWRWQSCLLRAYYDAYLRSRSMFEEELEQQANEALLEAGNVGASLAMDWAEAILGRAESEAPKPELRRRIVELCDALFQSIGLQTSVEKYQASDGQRGGVLDYVDLPLNNRWWLEDEFEKVRALPTEEQRVARLHTIATWENPGPGGYYDDVGNVAKSPHVIRGEWFNTDPNVRRGPNPDFMWWDGGMTRVRHSWIGKMDWPLGLRYEGLDPDCAYVVRTTGLRDCFLGIDGERVEPTIDGREIGELKEFPVPKSAYEDGIIVLTFDRPHEPEINWRQQSRLSEVWLIKR